MQDQITTQWTPDQAGTMALRAAVADVMRVEDVTNGVAVETVALMTRRADTAAREAEAVRLRGQLTVPSDQAYQQVSERFRRLGYTTLLRKGDGSEPGAAFFAVPGELRQARQRIVMSAVLFALTVLSCLFVGAQYVEGLTATNWNLLDGLPYTAGLLGILVAHEFGHYLAARRVGTPVSLPYFLPMPLGLGTFGAFINMTAPPHNRRQLLGIAAAGPLAGLVVAIPVLLIGLSLSSVQPLPVEGGYQIEGNSLLYAGMKFLVFGRLLPSAGEDVFIHQLAFAGWVGLLVTGLNLIPAGQLDGGHILYALVGERGAKVVFWVVLAVMATLSLLYSGWLLWVFLIFLLGRLRVMPLDDVTDLTTAQRALATAMIVIFVLVFTPRPFTFVPPM